MRRRFGRGTRSAALLFSFLVVSAVGCGGEFPPSAADGTPDAAVAPQSAPTGAGHLFVWAGDGDRQDSDFLAVIDARRGEPTYGEVVATLPVGVTGTMPHHTEYEFPPDGLLFANGWESSHTFVLDLREPRQPKLAADFRELDGYGFPHSFARLANGHRLGTFQGRDGEYRPPGGLVEVDIEGKPVRSASAADPVLDDSLVWPYSLTVLPEIDRVVTTSTEMDAPPWDGWVDTYHVQLWSLSDLTLLATLPIPQVEGSPYHLYPAEPRVLADGTVYFNTFNCGLYRIVGLEGVDGETPRVALVHTFPWAGMGHDCAGPLVYGHWWIQAVTSLPGLVVMDVTDPARPVEASRLVLDESYHMPHWVAADRAASRLVVTGMDADWVLIVDLDEATGTLTVDESFRSEGAERPGVSFDRPHWPHGETGGAIPHGALFGG